jgi:hypothetical protein
MTTYEPETPQEPQGPQEPSPEPEPTTEPGTEPTEPTEPPQEPQEPPAVPESEARIEQISGQLEKLNRHVAKRLGEILGDDAPFFETCEICSFSNTPGMRPSGPLPAEVQAAVYAALGQKTLDDLLDDPHSEVCNECGGKGSVKTRSEVEGQSALPCVKCGALGWLPTDSARGIRPGTAPNGVQPQALESAGGNAPQATPPAELDPRVAELQREGFVVIAPYVATS